LAANNSFPVTARALAGLEPGSPFGRWIEATVVYLHYVEAIGLERLRALMGERFGLAVSEGALSDFLAAHGHRWPLPPRPSPPR
jgi:hypothetical protein